LSVLSRYTWKDTPPERAPQLPINLTLNASPLLPGSKLMNESVVTARPLVSIVINNYNYDRFLSRSIDSALNQTYAPVEVIVVDDGSTDRSHEILNGYGRQIVAIFKSNGGQASAINEGIKVSSGKIVCFLDADDLFKLDKVEKIVGFLETDLSMDIPIILHNLCAAIDGDGDALDTNLEVDILAFPNRESKALSRFIEGYNPTSFFKREIDRVCHPDRVYEFVRRYRYIPYLGMPTSSISVSRAMVDLLFPLPVDGFKVSADELIVKAAALMGEVYSINLALTLYRLHENNNWYGKSMNREQEELAGMYRDKYLNIKLQSIGKNPVCCFPKSMQAASFYRTYFGKIAGDRLLSLAIDVIFWHLDYITLSFFIEMSTRGIYYKVRQLICNNFRSKQDLIF
jgi:glycosyltransferase involved in cell wall biosynthesis